MLYALSHGKPPLLPNMSSAGPLTQPEHIRVSIFLIGSIEMGATIDQQSNITKDLSDLLITIFDLHCNDWDKS